MEMSRAILAENNVWGHFSAEVVNITCYMANHGFTCPQFKKTPYELRNGRNLNISYSRNLDIDIRF